MFSYFFILIFSVHSLESCNKAKISLTDDANLLIKKIQKLEVCAKPVSPYLDKVYSNIKYRANRLKICINLVKKEDFGFDCSREFRKMKWSRKNNECLKEFKSVENFFKTFKTSIRFNQECKLND